MNPPPPPNFTLADLENLTRQIYSPTTAPLARFEAHKSLLFLQVSASYVDVCLYILKTSTEPTALLYAAQSLLLVFARDWSNISPDARHSLYAFLVAYLSSQGDIGHFLTKKLMQVLCTLTRRAWVEDLTRFSDIFDHAVEWLQSKDKGELGLRLISDLVCEFDQGRTVFYDEPMRRASQSFREQDAGLSRAFFLSVSAVWACAGPDSRPSLLEGSLQCLLSCLSYDFAGTGADESSLGIACVYLPKNWVQSVACKDALERFFNLYVSLWNRPGEHSVSASLLLQCLVLIAGTRRTVHDEETRSGFLNALMDGTTTLLSSRVGLDVSEECVHHLCRLIARSKTNAQVGELASNPKFSLWLQAITAFTCDCLRSWLTVSPRSVSYLLEFWQGLVVPMPYLRSAAMNPFGDAMGLGQATVAVFDAWLASRCAMAEAAADMAAAQKQPPSAPLQAAREAGLAPRQGDAHMVDLEEVNPLASEDVLLDELTMVLSLCRFRYPNSADSIARITLAALEQGGSAQANARCAVVLYLVGALVGGPFQQRDAGSPSQMDDINTELAALAFRVVLAEPSPSRGFALEMAVLYFVQCVQYHLIESRTRAQVQKSDLRMLRRRYWPLAIIDDSAVRWTGSQHRLASLPSSPSSSSLVGGAVEAEDVADMPPLLARPIRSFESETPFSMIEPEGGEDLPAAPSNQVIVDELDAIEAGGDVLGDFARVRASTIQRSITERLNIPGGDRALLDVAMQQIFAVLDLGRLEDSSPEEQVLLVERAMGVMRRLAQGSSIVHAGSQFSPRMVSSGVLLLESHFIQELLANPDPARFPLLQATRHMRARSFFMGTLAGLLFFSMDNQGDPAGVFSSSDQAEDRFVRFMQPLTDMADALLMAFDADPPKLKWALVGLLRDLRGVCSAAEDARHYALFFQWLFPTRFRLVAKAVGFFWDDVEVMIPLLRLLSELVANRGSRITFPISSSGGQVLLVETARLLTSFVRGHCARLRAGLSPASPPDPSEPLLSFERLRDLVEEMAGDEVKPELGGLKLRPGACGAGLTQNQSPTAVKCTAICATTLTRMMAGRFGNLSVFDLYNDSSLRDARAGVLELGLASTPEHIGGFPKAELQLVLLLHNVSETAPTELVGLSTPQFARMMAVLAAAVSRPQNVLLSTPAAFCIETLSVLRCRAILFLKSGLDFRTLPSGAVQLRKEGFVPSVLGGAGVQGKICSARDLHELARKFSEHDRDQPDLFSGMLWLLLDRVLSAPDSELPNLYAIARPVSVLNCCAPGALEVFANRFVMAQNPARRLTVVEKMRGLVALLNGEGPGVDIALVLRKHEELTKELCKAVRKWREQAM